MTRDWHVRIGVAIGERGWDGWDRSCYMDISELEQGKCHEANLCVVVHSALITHFTH
jgi:hypothetical protein